MIRVSRVTARTLGEVVRAFPKRPRALQEDRLREQAAGNLTHLVARRDGHLAGHVLLLHLTEREWDPFRERFACPEIGDLWVVPRHRGTGVGRALMLAAERLARRQGHIRVGLSTGIDRSYGPARALYASLGYRQVTGPSIDSWRTPARAGGWRADMEFLLGYFVKEF